MNRWTDFFLWCSIFCSVDSQQKEIKVDTEESLFSVPDNLLFPHRFSQKVFWDFINVPLGQSMVTWFNEGYFFLGVTILLDEGKWRCNFDIKKNDSPFEQDAFVNFIFCLTNCCGLVLLSIFDILWSPGSSTIHWISIRNFSSSTLFFLHFF